MGFGWGDGLKVFFLAIDRWQVTAEPGKATARSLEKITMALAQEFYDIFIRIVDVERVYPGGFYKYQTDFVTDIGHTIWFDDYLLREGAMSTHDAHQVVEHWKSLGLRPWREEAGKPVEWVELCVSSCVMGGPTLMCTWVAFDEQTHGAFLKGSEPRRLIGPGRRG